MAFANLARYTTTSTGTGTLSLTAVDGYAPTIANGSYRYFVIDETNNAREWGTGSVASMVLTRTTVEGGSNGTSAVNLGSGTKQVVFGPSATDLDAFAGAVTDLAAHLADTTDAHDASAISFSATGTIAATDVQTAVAEVATDAAAALSSHDQDTTNVHGITDTSTLITTSAIGVSVQAYSAVLAGTTASFTTADETKLDGIEAGATADQSAAEILSAILTVDGAGSGLDADLLDGQSSAAFATAGHDHSGTYQPLDADLTAIAGLTSAADRLPYFTGSGTAALATFTSAGRALVDDADATAQRATLGLVVGTDVQAYDADLAALAALSGTNTIYYRSAANTWSAVTIGTNLTFSGGTLSASGGGGSGDLVSTNNLSDVANAATSLSNLGGQPLDADLTSIAAIGGTNVIPYRSAADTWGEVTIGSGLDLTSGTLSVTATAGVASLNGETGALSIAGGAGTGITVGTPSGGSIPIEVSLEGGTGISIGAGSGNAKSITNTGVTSWNGSTGAVTYDAVTSIDGIDGAITLGSNLQISGGEISVTGVATDFALSTVKTASATMVVGEITQFDLDGASADFTATFPASLASGDRFAAVINREKSANAWGVKFADNGHTYNGSGSDIDSVFLCYTGEYIVFRVVDGPGGTGDTVIVESRLLKHGPLFVTLMDSDDAGFTAAVTLSSTSGGYGNDQKYANDASTKHGTWSFANCPPGQYKIWVCWSGDGNRSTSVRYVIGGPNTTSKTISGLSQVSTSAGQTDPEVASITWYELTNNFQLRGRGALTVEVHNDSSGYVISDGCRIERIGPLSY